MTVTRSLTIPLLLGVTVSALLMWTFGDLWSDFDKWDRTLAVLLLAAVWGFVAASIATVRQAFRRVERIVPEPQGAAGEVLDPAAIGIGAAVPAARREPLETMDRLLA